LGATAGGRHRPTPLLINAVQTIRVEEDDIRGFYIYAIVPELDTRIQHDLKGLILLRPAREVNHAEFNGIEYQVFITRPQPGPKTMIKRRLIKGRLITRGQQGNIRKREGCEFKAQQFVIDKKARLRMQRGPLSSIDGVPAEIA
jgi:hypothetical protein